MMDKEYRDAYVQSQIRTRLPFQLRALRKSMELSQVELAKLADMAQARISDLERPTGKLPKLDTLCRIASALDVAVEVRFLPFSKLIEASENFDPDNVCIKTFVQEVNEAKELELVAIKNPVESVNVPVAQSGVGLIASLKNLGIRVGKVYKTVTGVNSGSSKGIDPVLDKASQSTFAVANPTALGLLKQAI